MSLYPASFSAAHLPKFLKPGKIKKSDRDLPNLNYFLEKPDLEQIIEQTATLFGEDPALLKRVQINLCHKYSGQRLKDIGGHFGIGLSGVSQASRRLAVQIKDDKKLRKKVDKVILTLGLSNVYGLLPKANIPV